MNNRNAQLSPNGVWCDFCPFIMRVRDRVFSVRIFFRFHFYPSLTHCMPLRSFVTCFHLFPVCNKPVIPKYRHVDIHLWIMSAPDQVRILTLTCYKYSVTKGMYFAASGSWHVGWALLAPSVPNSDVPSSM